ncbi:MAG: glycosyltransferase family 39 protein [Anaerolineaceae bacterium]|nr:glycosyltransferase family 39 protein [Anaerolineaceae bacterium]
MTKKLLFIFSFTFGISFLYVLYITPFGIGISPDSTVYISGAKNLLSGNGFYNLKDPITHFPPVYSLLLAFVSLIEKDIVQSARIINAALYSLNLLLLLTIIYISTKANYFYIVIAIFLYLFSGQLIELHSMAWSEPLFISFMLIGIILLVSLVKKNSLNLLLGSAIFIGLGIITRYIGIAFIPASLIIVFFGFKNKSLRKRIGNSLLWLFVCLMPMLVFSLRNYLLSDTLTNRQFVFHPMDLKSFTYRLVINIFNFFLPVSLQSGGRPLIIGILALFYSLILFLLIKQNKIHFGKQNNINSMDIVVIISCVLFTVTYIGLLFVSISTFDAATPVDWRLLSPIFILGLILFILIARAVSIRLDNKIVFIAFLAILSLSLITKLPDAIAKTINIRNSGRGYTSNIWQNSDILKYIRTLPSEIEIFTNGSDVINFYYEKQTSSLPKKFNSNTSLQNANFEIEIGEMCNEVKEGKAIIVYFSNINRKYLPTTSEVEKTCELLPVKKFTDGVIY